MCFLLNERSTVHCAASRVNTGTICSGWASFLRPALARGGTLLLRINLEMRQGAYSYLLILEQQIPLYYRAEPDLLLLCYRMCQTIPRVSWTKFKSLSWRIWTFANGLHWEWCS